MYDWRQMTPRQRQEVLNLRKQSHVPWHSPPHRDIEHERCYLISSTCYEHAHIIGKSPQRMTECEESLLEICRRFPTPLYAWAIMTNHYHLVVQTDGIKVFRLELGRFHGRSSFRWNREDNSRGRQVWYNCFERPMKSESHFWTTLNYVHHNPVHHGRTRRWQDWPYSSAVEFLEQVGRERAAEIWRNYPVRDYGKKWDV